MKVKPFSYHVPRRKFNPATSSLQCSPPQQQSLHNCDSSSRGTRRRNSNIIRNHQYAQNHRRSGREIILFSICYGIGGISLLNIVLLVGFIGVAGQGKFPEMDSTGSSSKFPPEGPLSYPSFTQRGFPSLTRLAGGLEEESDEALQQKITTMGQYGIKYTNDSYNNFSSYLSSPHSYYYNEPHSHKPQYKPESGPGILLSSAIPVDQSILLSLNNEDDKSKENHSEGDNQITGDGVGVYGNKITQESLDLMNRIATRKQRKYLQEKGHQESQSDSNTPENKSSKRWVNHTSPHSHKRLSHIFIAKSSPNKFGSNKNKGKEEKTRSSFPSSLQDIADEDDNRNNEDSDAFERFTPGNISHTSGKQRFRQSSQAEIDALELDGYGVVSTVGATESLSGSSRRRSRRSVVHLYDMVVWSTGCNPLIFKGYGCYCGFLGSGLTVDGIDKCCAKHDFCYHHAKCPPLLTYFVPYYWRCDHGRPECVTDFRGWKGVCGSHLCECDRQFAECLKKFPCPRSRAMCVTSPWSSRHNHNNWHTGSRAFPFTVGRGPRTPWRLPPSSRITPLYLFPPHPPMTMGVDRFFL